MTRNNYSPWPSCWVVRNTDEAAIRVITAVGTFVDATNHLSPSNWYTPIRHQLAFKPYTKQKKVSISNHWRHWTAELQEHMLCRKKVCHQSGFPPWKYIPGKSQWDTVRWSSCKNNKFHHHSQTTHLYYNMRTYTLKKINHQHTMQVLYRPGMHLTWGNLQPQTIGHSFLLFWSIVT